MDSVKNTWKDDDELEQFGSRGGFKTDKYKVETKRLPLNKMQTIIREARASIWRVFWVAGLYYLYLARYG
jgi:hypothetical protein